MGKSLSQLSSPLEFFGLLFVNLLVDDSWELPRMGFSVDFARGPFPLLVLC